MGLLVALQRYVEATDESRQGVWLARVQQLAAGLQNLTGAAVSVRDGRVPKLVITLANAREVCRAWQDGEPSLQVDPSEADEGRLLLNPTCLAESDLTAILQTVHGTLK